MSISDNYAPQSTQGNGATTVFTGSWSPIVASYFKLDLELISTGVRTPQTQGVGYTLTFTDAGYSATMAVAPSSLYNVIRYREVAVEQDVNYTTSSGYQGAVLENSLDLLTAAVQDVADGVGRSPQFAVGSTTSDITFPEPEADLFIAWNSAGTDLINTAGVAGPTGPAGPAVADGDKGDIIVSSSGTVWTIDNNAVSLGKLATQAANTVLMNATAGTAVPTAVVLTTSTILGMGGTGNGGALAISSDLTLAATTLGVNTGTGANQIVKLNGSSQLPAVDGSLLTGVGGAPTGTSTVWTSGSTKTVTVDFATYFGYIVQISGLVTGGVNPITLRMSSNSGSSYATTTYSSLRNGSTSFTSGIGESGGGAATNVTIFVLQPSTSSVTTGTGQANYTAVGVAGSCSANTSAAVNLIELGIGGGDSASAGTIIVTPISKR